VFKDIAARLEDSDWYVRAAAVEAFGRHTTLLPVVIKAIVARLDDSDWYVRKAAAESLGRQATLPLEVLKAIAARFTDSDEVVRAAAIKALGRQPALPPKVLKDIVAQLEDSDGDVRKAAAEALRRQPDPSTEVVKAIVVRLEDSDGDVRRVAAEALGLQPDLPTQVVKAIAARLKESAWDVRAAEAEALRSQLDNLPTDVIKAGVEHSYRDPDYFRMVGPTGSKPTEYLDFPDQRDDAKSPAPGSPSQTSSEDNLDRAIAESLGDAGVGGPPQSSINGELEAAWRQAERSPHDLAALFNMFSLSQRKYFNPNLRPSVHFNFYFFYIYTLHQITRKCREWGLGDVDWEPFASKDELMMLVPHMKRVPWSLVSSLMTALTAIATGYLRIRMALSDVRIVSSIWKQGRGNRSCCWWRSNSIAGFKSGWDDCSESHWGKYRPY
jgi:hypothetical protein